MQEVFSYEALRQQAGKWMEEGFHCSQCVFPYLAQRQGVDKELALRLSAGLGGGCFHGELCGAVSGAILALGTAYGFDQPDKAQDEILIEKVREFERQFLQEHGSLLCRQLLGGYDKAYPGVEIPVSAYDNCAKYCADACRIALQLTEPQA